MSRNLFYRTIKLINILKTNLDISITQKFQLLSVGLFCHGCYVYGTVNTKSIIASKKYTFVQNGFTEFMIIDEKGNHFNVNNSVWLLSWEAIEKWNEISINDKLVIQYYGIRIPIIGLFPVIVKNYKRTFKGGTK
jgi:hypothetical protein